MTTQTRHITTLNFLVRIVIEKDEPGYHAFTPSLKGLHLSGDTPEEALVNAKEATALFLKSMLKHGDPIPLDLIETGRSLKNREIISSNVEEIQVAF